MLPRASLLPPLFACCFSFGVAEKVCYVNAQRLSKHFQRLQGGIASAPLNAADVSAVETALIAKGILRGKPARKA